MGGGVKERHQLIPVNCYFHVICIGVKHKFIPIIVGALKAYFAVKLHCTLRCYIVTTMKITGQA